MDTFSMMDDDPTLPIDFDQSTNLMKYLTRDKKDGMENLQEVFFSNHEDTISISESESKPGSARNDPNSPDRGTMRDHEEIIGALKKENFGLKLRIYFLEERLQMAYEGDTEDILKTNIELKVNIEQLKKDLTEKQNLLIKASKAMETISVESEKHINNLKDEFTKQFNDMRDQLQEELDQREKEIADNQVELEELNKKIVETEKLRHELENNLDNFKGDSSVIEKMQSKHKEIEEKYEKENQEKDLKIKDLMERASDEHAEDQIKDLKAIIAEKDVKIQNLQDGLKDLASQSPDRSNQHYEVLYNKLEAENVENEKKIKELSKELRTKTNLVQELKDYINKTDRVNKELRNSIHDKETEKHRSSMSLQEHIRWKLNNRLRDLLCSVRLDLAISNKDKEISKYRDEIEKLENLLKELQAELDEAKRKLNDIESISNKDISEALAALLADLQEKDFILKKNKQALLDKDKDLQYFNSSKLRAEQDFQNLIAQKNIDIQTLTEDVKKLTAGNADKLLALEDQCQRLQEDSQMQLNMKDKLIQRLSNALRNKDLLIQELATPPESFDTSAENLQDNQSFVLQKLRTKIKDLDQIIEANLDDKFKAINDKDQELLEIRRTLRGKDREIDALQANVTTSEEVIKHLESVGKEKDKTLQGLKAALEMQGNAFKVSSETANKSIQDSQLKMVKLKSLLDAKETEVTNDDGNRTDSSTTNLQKLVKELTSERDTALNRNETNRQKFISVLNENDLHLKDLFKMLTRTTDEKNATIKQLKNALQEKHGELMAADNKLTEARKDFESSRKMQQKNGNEKDLAIQDLVKSGQEKDRIISELHELVQTKSKPATVVTNPELENLKELCSRLQDELNKKEETIKDAKAENKKARDELDNQQRLENIEITLKFDNLKHDLESKGRQLNESRDKVGELQRENDALQNIIDGHRDKIQAFQSNEITQTQRIEELNKLCEEKDATLRDLQNQANFSEDVQETLQKLQEQKVNLEQRLKDLHAEANSLKASKDALEKKLAESSELNVSLTAELEDLKSMLKSSISPEVADKLKAEIENLKLEIEKKRSMPKRESQLIGAGEDEIDSSDVKELFKMQLQQQKELMNATEQERLRYQSLIEELNNKSHTHSSMKGLEFELEAVSDLRSKYEEGLRQNEVLREHLENEIKAFKETKKMADENQVDDSNAADQDILKLRSQLEESERWNRSLQSRLDQVSPRSGGVGGPKDQVDSGGRNPFEADITVMVERLQTERDDLQSKLKKQQAECALLRKELREVGSDAEEAKAGLAEFKLHYDRFSQLRDKEIANLTDNCNEAKTVIKNMEDEIAALNEELKLQKRLQDENDNEAVAKQMTQIDEVNKVLRNELNERIEEIQTMKEKARDEQEKAKKFKENLDLLKNDKKILMNQIEDKNKELKKLIENTQDLKQNIARIETERDSLEKRNKDLNSIQQDRNELRALNERLRNKLGEVSKTYEDLKGTNDGEIVALNDELKKSNARIEDLKADNEEANAITMRLRDEIRSLQEASRNVQRLTDELRNSENINKVLQRQLNDVAKASELRKNTLDPEIELIKQKMHEFQITNGDLQEKLREYERQVGMLKNELSKERSVSLVARNGFEVEIRRLADELAVVEEAKNNLETHVKELSYINETYKGMIESLEEQNKKKEDMTNRLEKELSRQKAYADIATSMTPQKTANVQTTPTRPRSSADHVQDVTFHEAIQKRDAYIAAMRQQLEFYKQEKQNAEIEKHVKDNAAKEKTDSLIAAHIAEMRELRRELEQSIRNNDALRAQLEHRLSQAEKEAAQFKDPQMRATLLRENDSLRARINEKESRIESLKSELEAAVKAKERSSDSSFSKIQIMPKDFESTRLDFNRMQKFAPQETSSALTSPLNSITAFTQTTPCKPKRNQETQVDAFMAQITAEKREMQRQIDSLKETVRSKNEAISSLEQIVKSLGAAREQKNVLEIEVGQMKMSLDEKVKMIQRLELKLQSLEKTQTLLTAATESRESSRESRASNKSKSTNDELIALHISEMRDLKKELELSIKNNDSLRSQLEHRLKMVERDAEYIKDPQLRVHVIRDNDMLRTQSIERQNMVVRQKNKIEDLIKEKQSDKEKIKKLHQQIHDLNKLTSNLQQEVSLYDRLQEQLNATATRNKTISSSPDSGINLRSKTPTSRCRSSWLFM